ncbi:hypothetical protein ONQ60_26305, partial [Salmonella enterica subsp. enterica serovar Virginia]|nr:hypothetical protein [Salmonella enterica subsp. enterica serovar Virginia]
ESSPHSMVNLGDSTSRMMNTDGYAATGVEIKIVDEDRNTLPAFTAETREAAFRLLCLNHTFTSYISALGAHREKLSNPDVLGLL